MNHIPGQPSQNYATLKLEQKGLYDNFTLSNVTQHSVAYNSSLSFVSVFSSVIVYIPGWFSLQLQFRYQLQAHISPVVYVGESLLLVRSNVAALFTIDSRIQPGILCACGSIISKNKRSVLLHERNIILPHWQGIIPLWESQLSKMEILDL